MRRIRPLSLCAIWVLLAQSDFVAAQSPSLSTLLERTAAYVVKYQTSASGLVAEEHYLQTDRSNRFAPVSRRTLVSDLLLLRDPIGGGWLQFRDVFEVDGRAVRDRTDRLEKLFLCPPPDAVEQARAILDDSARYNPGTVVRTINVPLLAMAVLQPENRQRFAFELTNTGNVSPFTHLAAASAIRAFAFRQVEPGWITGENGRHVPASGRFWIDSTDGRILRSQLTVDDGQVRGRIEVVYRHDSSLAMLVPAEMHEQHRGVYETIDGTATYQSVRRFAVAVDERVDLPPR